MCGTQIHSMENECQIIGRICRQVILYCQYSFQRMWRLVLFPSRDHYWDHVTLGAIYPTPVADLGGGGAPGARTPPPFQPDNFISLLGHTPTTCLTTCLTWMDGPPPPPFPTSWILHWTRYPRAAPEGRV